MGRIEAQAPRGVKGAVIIAGYQAIHIDLTDNSGLVKEEMVSAALRGLEKCGLTAEKYAKMLCPVDTGNLLSSITHQVQPSELKVYVGVPHGPTSYGAYVELGTGKYYPGGRQTPWVYQDAKGQWHLTYGQRAQPYLKPAVAGHQPEFIRIMEGEMKG